MLLIPGAAEFEAEVGCAVLLQGLNVDTVQADQARKIAGRPQVGHVLAARPAGFAAVGLKRGIGREDRRQNRGRNLGLAAEEPGDEGELRRCQRIAACPGAAAVRREDEPDGAVRGCRGVLGAIGTVTGLESAPAVEGRFGDPEIFVEGEGQDGRAGALWSVRPR